MQGLLCSCLLPPFRMAETVQDIQRRFARLCHGCLMPLQATQAGQVYCGAGGGAVGAGGARLLRGWVPAHRPHPRPHPLLRPHRLPCVRCDTQKALS